MSKQKEEKKVDKQTLTKAFKGFKSNVVKHSPEILTGIGIAGMITTTILAVKATPKALEKIEEAEHKKFNEKHLDEFYVGKEPLTRVEVVKAAWKPYIPAAVTGVASIGCLIGSNTVSARRNAALATAYQLSTTALNEYKDKVLEVVGEEKAHEIREKVVEEKKDNVVNTGGNTIIISNDNDILIYEPFSNQEFKSTTNKVEKAMIALNKKLTTGSEHAISLNEFLTELELDKAYNGDSLGWTPSCPIDITFDADMNKHGKPRLKIAYLTPPFYDYDKYY